MIRIKRYNYNKKTIYIYVYQIIRLIIINSNLDLYISYLEGIFDMFDNRWAPTEHGN